MLLCVVLEVWSHPVEGLLEAVQPVFAGRGVLGEVHRVRDVGRRVLQQMEIHQLPLQTVHLQHVELRHGTDKIMQSQPHYAPPTQKQKNKKKSGLASMIDWKYDDNQKDIHQSYRNIAKPSKN